MLSPEQIEQINQRLNQIPTWWTAKRQRTERHELNKKLKQHEYATFNINDLVLVKTLNSRSKFDTRYEGPFRIIKQVTPKTFVVQHVKKSTLYRQVTSDVLLPICQRIN